MKKGEGLKYGAIIGAVVGVAVPVLNGVASLTNYVKYLLVPPQFIMDSLKSLPIPLWIICILFYALVGLIIGYIVESTQK